MENKITFIVGARPNFIKIAPLLTAAAEAGIDYELLHTGQHYDKDMNQVFFDELDIPRPNKIFIIEGKTQIQQLSEIMTKLELHFLSNKTDAIVVVGDVTSTLAGALVGSKLGIKVCHVEAGLRSFDRKMPEEINRVITDQISDLLFTTERIANVHLQNEGISEDKIFFVGNVMIDSLLANVGRAKSLEEIDGKYGRNKKFLEPQSYVLVTLHRPSNVDNELRLAAIVEELLACSRITPILFPLHPRTRNNLELFGLGKLFKSSDILFTPPLTYLEMIGAMRHARFILTDSGGIQEEATGLGVSCRTFRESTERPITIDSGTNRLIGTKVEAIRDSFNDDLTKAFYQPKRPELWDGSSSNRIIAVIADKLY